MSMTKNKWEIIHDCDMEDGTPTSWAIKTGKDENEKNNSIGLI